MNLPNILTLLRIIMIPAVAVMFSYERFSAAAIIFLVACLTDILDGYLARRMQLITDIGKLLDPLADKGMQLTVLISLAWSGRMPSLAVWIILGKEFLMFLGGLFLYRRNIVVYANWYGKAATVLISVCVMAVMLLYRFLSPFWLTVCQWVPTLAALAAFILYFISFLKTLREEKAV